MKYSLVAAAALVLMGAVAASLLCPRPTVDGVMEDFYRNDAGRAEDMLIDPLILHSDLIKERVIHEIADRAMPKRRYAIGFLGVARIPEALPMLRTILSNEQEKDIFRADALASIYQIAEEQGLALASDHQLRADHLGYIARGLLDGSHKPFERSYAQAAIGYHE